MNSVTQNIAVAERKPTVNPRPQPDGFVPACILVVDDQPADLELLSSVLGGLGHEIIPAADGATALKRLTVRVPDLILLAVLMPEVDGFEVCRRLQTIPEGKNIPIIFLSADADKELVVRALNADGMDYVTKPFSQAELIWRVRTQLALKTARDRLKQIAEDQDELIGILTHDLKNSLGGIHLSAELLHAHVKHFDDERSLQLSENILRTSAQSLAFVKAYLANAACDHAFVPKPAMVNFAETAKVVIRQYREQARRKGLEIRTDISAANGEATVFADAAAVGQVLENLLSNALKFSPPGKNVFVAIRPATGQVECVIRDEGPGFTAEDKLKMFHRYGRLSARPTDGEPSTGLGLSIVRKLVRAMNGELSCESEPGSGAAFTVRLPKPN